MRNLALAALFAALTATAHAETRTFTVTTSDGAPINGQSDSTAPRARTAVIFVAGTGMFDRDASFGRSGTPRDLIFADLAQRMNAQGLATVRYDRRGLRYGATGAERIDTALASAATNESQIADLAAVYAWAQARDGLNARCVIFFGHSEGMAHIGRLADSGARRPLGVIGMGALLESPRSVFHWQRTGRDAHSLRMMDSDGDGATTNEEVQANFMRTPSGVWENSAPFMSPTGAWDAATIAAFPQIQESAIYNPERAHILAQPANAPFPNAETPMASYAWIQSFFTDETPIAARLARWNAPMIFHYGSYDSQTVAERQQAAAAPLQRARFTLHANRGHSLGEHPLFGPIDEAIADQIAADAATLARACR